MPRDAYQPCIYYKTNHDFQPCKKKKRTKKTGKNEIRAGNTVLSALKSSGISDFCLKKAESADDPKKSAKKLY